MQEFYDITVAGVKRSLPVVPINENMSIAGFVIFGDTDVVEPCARALAEKLPPETEVLVTAEAKSIPLIYEMAKVMKMPRYVIARKSVKGYMRNPIITTVNSITNMGKEQILVVDEHDAEFIKGKKVAIIDDVISTGSSIEAIEKLVKESGGEVIARAAVLAMPRTAPISSTSKRSRCSSTIKSDLHKNKAPVLRGTGLFHIYKIKMG